MRTPAYFISTVEDHIAPWKSTYLGAKRLGGPVRFVLGGSGHIAGIVNPPAAKKYCYWLNDALPSGPDEWQAGATRHDGSWWNDWQAWMEARSAGERVPARRAGRRQAESHRGRPRVVRERAGRRRVSASRGLYAKPVLTTALWRGQFVAGIAGVALTNRPAPPAR